MNKTANALGSGAYLLRLLTMFLICCAMQGGNAVALERMDVAISGTQLDLTPYFARLESDTRTVSVPMPQGLGEGDLLTLKAAGHGPHFVWLVGGVTNRSATPQQLVLGIERQGFAGSGLVWPLSLGAPGATVSALGGVQISPLPADPGKAWLLTLGPGKSGGVVIELDGGGSAALTLWRNAAYEDHKSYGAFFRGALLGITVLLCLALFALYGWRGRLNFLTAAGFALACVGFMLIETGHIGGLLSSIGATALSPDTVRAVIESLMVTTLILFLVTSTHLQRGAPIAANLLLAAAGLSLALPVFATLEPLQATGIARLLFGALALAGFATVFVFWQRGGDKLESALASWAAILLWSFLALVVVLSGGGWSVLSPLLLAGLAAVLVVITFSLAHQSLADGYLAPHLFRDAGRRALALAGARAYVWDWQAETGHLFLAEEFEGTLGLQPGLLAETGIDGFLELMHPVDRAAYLAAVEVAERQGNGIIESEFRLRHAEGGYRWFQLRGRAMPGQGKRAARCIGTLTDITNSKIIEERLLNDAVYDMVTGLPNRALLLDRLARATAAAVPGDPDGLYVLLIDIDRFKTVNEALGHEQGDALLTIIGRRLSVEMAPADSVARMPGDQFAVLYAGAASRDIASFAEALRKAVARPINLDGQDIFLSACIGIAQYREAGLAGEQMLKDAAIALYEAKRRGAGGMEVFQSSMRDDRAELVVLESELRRAIERNEFEVHYQPIARLADMNLAGFEALVRWRHPGLGLLSPESFIGLAEQTGMIKEIGLLVLDEAGRQLGIWQRAFLPAEPLFVAVNISSAQLLETGLIDDIKLLLHREGVRRASLKIEVTESLVMQYPDRAGQILERIRELGVGIACDDFGTGYSSLASLRKLPFDTLKVDRSFIGDEAGDPRAVVILEAIIALGHALGLTIVAEGIENQEQVDRLGLLGCDLGQGYFIGRAMTAKQVSDALSGLPYATQSGRTAITWLWERATRDPAPEPTRLDMTAAGIDEARARELDARRSRERQIAERLNAERLAMLRQSAIAPPASAWPSFNRTPPGGARSRSAEAIENVTEVLPAAAPPVSRPSAVEMTPEEPVQETVPDTERPGELPEAARLDSEEFNPAAPGDPEPALQPAAAEMAETPAEPAPAVRARKPRSRKRGRQAADTPPKDA